MDRKGAEAERPLSCLPAEAATAVCLFFEQPLPHLGCPESLSYPRSSHPTAKGAGYKTQPLQSQTKFTHKPNKVSF